MPEMKFTDEQQNVIDVRNSDVLVSAAAGSGKTAVLVERIIRRILDDNERLSVDRLLVVTFTEAAAAQMRQRIGDAIKDKLKADPDNDHLQQQSSLLYKAQISTIHSFCLNIIRNNFDRIGLDPSFSVGDETELKMLKEDVMDALFERLYEEENSSFTDCVKYFCNSADDKRLRELVLKLSETSDGYPWPQQWLDELDSPAERYMGYLLDHTGYRIKDALNMARKALDIALSPMGPYGYEQNLRDDISLIESLNNLSTYEDIHSFFLNNPGLSRLSGKAGDDVSDELKERVKELRNGYKDIVFGTKVSSIKRYYETEPETEQRQNEQIRPYLSALAALSREFLRDYTAAKTDRGIISFSDMEHYALNILYEVDEKGYPLTDDTGKWKVTEVAGMYRNAFDEILMDEYQDCNRVQELIISAVAGDEDGRYNRFMVGDIKQSIYKFRLASPELFIEKYKSYEIYDPQSQKTGSHVRIDLHSNFRSRKTVINTVNDLFGQIMHEEIGNVEYDETAVLNYHGDYPGESSDTGDKTPSGYETQILLSNKNTDTDGLSEARMIASKIRELKSSFLVTEDKETGKMRPLKYGDIVILLRSMTDVAAAINKVFSEEGIPCHMSLKTGFFEAREIQDIIHMLKVIDNPLQETALFGAMTSFFGGLSDEDVAVIRTKGNGPDLYRQALSLRNDYPKTGRFLDLIDRFRKLAVYTPIHELISELVFDTGYMEHVGAMAAGLQRKANIHMLIERAADYESSSYKGLFNFVRYISKIKDTETDTGEADVLDENADVVRIMTIHKSKGLEFPVCFLSGIHKQFNQQDLRGDLLIDIDNGAGAAFIDTQRRIKTDTLRKKVAALKMRNDMTGEELRVLYVAMTRAREKLIITGTVDRDKHEKYLEGPMSLFDAMSYYDMLYPMLKDAVFVDDEDIRATQRTEALSRLELCGELRKQIAAVGHTGKLHERLKDRFARVYPHPELSDLIVKTSVSELKKAYLDSEFTRELFTPGDDLSDLSAARTHSGSTLNSEQNDRKEATGSRMSGTDRGSAYHKIMELLDFTDTDIKSQINKFINNGLISNDWAEAVNTDKIRHFTESDIGKRMAKAQENRTLRREQPFMLGISADRVKEGWPDTETVLLQGIIDVFFEEDGGIILLDYKTDVIKTPEELSKRYRIQLDYYAEALERVIGKPVREKILYSFCLEQSVILE
ncbi:MAG: helicase-exonuclease AddAB subunit AddA [Lachnospiraceae bacterium]|nr:helicase-exonuclease AddAB subunit AddA [Lachnospiraceae bacterium]